MNQELRPIIDQEITNKLDKHWLGAIENKDFDELLKELFDSGLVNKIISLINSQLQPFISDAFPENQKYARSEIEKIIKEIAQLKYEQKLSLWLNIKWVGELGYNAVVAIVSLMQEIRKLFPNGEEP